MEHFLELLRQSRNDLLAFLRWTLISLMIGGVVGGVGILFHYSTELAADWRESCPWLLWLLPLGGVGIAGLYRLCGMEKDRGADFVLTAVRRGERLPVKTAPLVFAGTVITHLLGGSSGREGAALQIGGSLSAQLGRWMRMDDKDARIITMCGMSAAFSALFGTPLTAAVFSMEVVSVGVMYYSALVPCMLSSLTGAWLAGQLSIAPTRFSLAGVPELAPLPALQTIGLAVLCALLSILFCVVMHLFRVLYQRYIKNAFLIALTGGALVVLLTLLTGTRDYNGAGMPVIARALAGEARPEAFALKMLFTALTLGAGFKGGEIIPVFFCGATFGNVMGGLLGLNPSFGAGLGLTALFCGVTNCPLTSLLLGVELFGANGFLYIALAVAVSYCLSGYGSLYSEQRIIYSKLRPEFIDKQAE
ncbi:MAG: chloride channel protein [Clostridiales bacterium]|nr:chloride channel protein [Clostridiales bacterium]